MLKIALLTALKTLLKDHSSQPMQEILNLFPHLRLGHRVKQLIEACQRNHLEVTFQFLYPVLKEQHFHTSDDRQYISFIDC